MISCVSELPPADPAYPGNGHTVYGGVLYSPGELVTTENAGELEGDPGHMQEGLAEVEGSSVGGWMKVDRDSVEGS